MCPLHVTGPGKTVLMCRRTEIHFIASHTRVLSYAGLFLLTADSGPVKCIQVSTEARGLLAGVYKVEWVCVTAHRRLV